MRILGLSEFYFGVSGILVLNDNRLAEIRGFIKNILVFVLAGPCFVGSAGTYIYYHPDEFEHCLTSIALVCAGVLITGIYCCLKFNEKQLKKLIEQFQKTVDEGLFNFIKSSSPVWYIFLIHFAFSIEKRPMNSKNDITKLK